MKLFFHMSGLRARLLVAVLLVLVPLLSGLAFAQWHDYRQQVATLRADTLQVARNLVRDHEVDLESLRAVLIGIGEVPQATEHDRATCVQRLATIRAQYSVFANLAVARPDGDVVCSAVAPPGKVNLADRAWFKYVMANKRMSQPEYLVGRISGKPTVAIGYPVLGTDSVVRQVLVAALDLDTMVQRLIAARLPDQSLVMLIDPAGTVLMRSPGDPVWIGRSVVGTGIANILRVQGAAAVELHGLDGVERLYAVQTLGAADTPAAYLTVGVPTSVIDAPARESFYRAAIVLGAVVLLVIVVVIATDRMLVRPLRQLARAAQQFGAGEPSVALPLRAAGETGELAREFEHMMVTLKRRERLLSESQRIAHIGSWSLDVATNKVTWSGEAYRLHGLAPRAIAPVFQEVESLVHPDDIAASRRWINDSLAGKAPPPLEARAVWPSGEVHWMMGTVELIRDAAGNPVELIGTVQDITERRRAEAALRETQRQLTSLIAHVPGVVYRCRNDPSWTTEFVSEGVLQLFGYPVADFMEHRREIGQSIHPEDQGRVWDEIQAALREHRRYELTYRIISASGEEKWLWEQGAGVFDANGTLLALEGFGIDITARKQAEADRLRLQQQLQQAQKMEALGQLTGGIAHDFNNILASILGYTDLVLERPEIASHAVVADYLRQVKRAGERARDLIANMMAFSRVRAGAEAAPLNAASLVNEAFKLLGAAIPSSIHVDVRIEPGVPRVMFNSVALHQSLLNLCINARDALHGQGKIEISLARAPAVAAVCDSCHQPVGGDFVALTVRDNGEGIAPDVVSRMFEPFFTTKGAGKGTGLGLAMVHGVVHEYGGHIRVQSQPGQGTAVTLWLAVATEAASAAEAAPALAPPGRGERVLVVDDEKPLAELLGELLTARGYRPCVYTDSRAALAAFEAAPDNFDVAVIDQTMPGMTGAELAIAMLGRRPDLPIVMCTGYSEQLDEAGARKLGIRRYLLKPVSRETLLTALHAELQATA